MAAIDTPHRKSAWDREMIRDVLLAFVFGLVAATLIAGLIALAKFVSIYTTQQVGIFAALALTAKTIFATLKDSQTLLAGVFGFVGLFGVANLAARHTRDRDRELLDQRRRSLAAALQVEIAYCGAVCRTRVKDIEKVLSENKAEIFKMPPEEWEIMKVGGLTIYQANAGEIGHLPSEAVRLVVRFYTLIINHNLNVSGGVVSISRKDDMEGAAANAVEATAALQSVIDGKFDS